MDTVEIEQIRISQEDGHVLVEVMMHHMWYPVIKETFDRYPIHTVTASGIDDKVYRLNNDLLRD